MNTTECPFESDLVDAIHAARWPTGADASLVAHVETCEICHDVATVLPAVLELVDGPDETTAHLPEAGAVWIRAQWRARAEAERTATHPITAAQGVAIAGGAAVVGALVGASSAWLQSGVGGVVVGLAHGWSALSMPDAVATALSGHLALSVSVALAMVLVPVTAYLVTRE
jgi:hypothetical protein